MGIAALVVIALVVSAWYGLSIRQAHDTAAAAAIVTGSTPLAPAEARHASDLLGSAGRLNPDRQVDVLRAQLALAQGDRLGARRILEHVVAQEPENAVAWEWLARASSDDRHEFFFALIHLRQLVPPVRLRP
ncbi:MAG: hypothetical protein JO244_09135 [Solirubrobacterales bacterium]|nr:hypothetical protein [Solirubrobacterales bacterium]